MRTVSVFSCSLAVAAGFLAAINLTPLALFLLTAIWLACLWLFQRRLRKPLAILGCISIAAVCYFWGYEMLHRSVLVSHAQSEKRAVVTGTIDSAVRRDGDTVQFVLLVRQIGFTNREPEALERAERIAVRLRLKEERQIPIVEKWNEGDQLHARLSLSLPDGSRNPNGFDYRVYLRWQGISVTAAGEWADVLVHQPGRNLFAHFHQLQMRAGKQLEEFFPDREASGYLQALLTGMSDGPDPEIEEIYSNLGLIHVLAISGLHVTLVSGFFMTLLRLFRMKDSLAFLLACLGILFYVLFVGASPSAVRAGLMGALFLWGRYMEQHWPARELLGAGLLCMLLSNPYHLGQIGFVLSFFVTWGLIQYVPLLMSIGYPRPEWLRSLFAVTTAAQLVSFPLIVYWFHQVSPLSWGINLVAVPILSLIILPLGYFGLLAGLLHPALARIPAELVQPLLSCLHSVLQEIDRWHLPFTHWPHPHWTWLGLYGAILVFLPICWRRGWHRKRDMIGYGVLLGILLIGARQPFSGLDEVRITFLDVGQGDAAVVEIGKRLVYLIDSGGTPHFPKKEWQERRKPYEVGKNRVLPYLRSRGIERIDRLVLTHGDFDHIGGLASVLPHVSVGMALVNGKQPGATESHVLNMLQEGGVPIRTGQPGLVWEDAPGVRWTWLWPEPGTMMNDNDASIVLLLEAYGKRVLFTGDMEETVEHRGIKLGLWSHVDILKVAHHGSKTSTSSPFLDILTPAVAVISVGENNRYGHPAPEVIERLEAREIPVFRTDEHGAITFILNQTDFSWQTHIYAEPAEKRFLNHLVR